MVQIEGQKSAEKQHLHDEFLTACSNWSRSVMPIMSINHYCQNKDTHTDDRQSVNPITTLRRAEKAFLPSHKR